MSDSEKRSGFAAAMSATGHFQDHPDGTLATDMSLRDARSLAYTMPDPARPCVVRCPDGVLLCTPPKAGARDIHLRERGWEVDTVPESGTLVAWRQAEPAPPAAWQASVAAARDELMSRVSSIPPQAVLGVVARHGGGGIDEIALVLSPSASASDELLAMAGGDIEAGKRTFLVDAFRDGVPSGFLPVPLPDASGPDPSEAAAAAGELLPRPDDG